jgi:hypothetical protein
MLKLELSEQMISVIGKALGAQPFDVVAPVIAELQKQISAQQGQSGEVIPPAPIVRRKRNGEDQPGI